MQVSLDTMESAIRLIDDLAGLGEPSRFTELALPGLARLISCDLLTYKEIGTDGVRYEEFRRSAQFGPMRYRLAVALPGTTFTFQRGDRDFTTAERATLAILREPLTHALDRTSRRSAGLTPREAMVLELVALGRTNAAIARRLGTSPRTVAKHLEHIYRKLGVSGRAAAVGHRHSDYASANGVYPSGAGVVP